MVIPRAPGREAEKPMCKQRDRSKACDYPTQRPNLSKGVGGKTKNQDEGEPPARDIETTASAKKVIASGEKRGENKRQIGHMDVRIGRERQVAMPAERD